MNILSHRGLWHSPKEKNTFNSLIEALNQGFGIETDLRDFEGEIQISHDPILEPQVKLTTLLQAYRASNSRGALALNIKADGLLTKLQKFLQEYAVEEYFIFDMSIPQLFEAKQIGLSFFTRFSDIEPFPLIEYESCSGVWFDSFYGRYDNNFFQKIQEVLENNKKVALVSPELHGRPYKKFWDELRTRQIDKLSNVFLCTDLSLNAKDYFSL